MIAPAKRPRAKPVDREGPIQAAIVAWLRAVLPPQAKVHHSPNEVQRRGKLGMIEVAKKRQAGTIAGWPDIEILLPGPRTLFMEVKAPKEYPPKDQRDLHADLEAIGYPVAVVRSIEDARAALAAWGVKTREVVA